MAVDPRLMHINRLLALPNLERPSPRSRHAGGWLWLPLLAVMLVGCGRPETRVAIGDREGILHRGNGAEPQDLDPHTVTGVPEHYIIAALLEGLVSGEGKELTPTPGVAERWEMSEDGKVYTFHLRADAKWSNGEPVTAHDFVRSYRRMLAPTLASEYAYMHFVVKNAEAYNKGDLKDFNEVGYKAVNDRTLRVELVGSTPYFLSLLNHYSWYPVHIPTIEKHGPPDKRGNRWTRPENFVGNGPFVLAEWKILHRLVVKKSPTYWDRDTVKLKEVRFYPMESFDAEERAFRAGQLHMTYEAPLPKIESYRKRNSPLLRIDPYLGTYFYRLNTTRPPLNDPRVRRALALALDREGVANNIRRAGEAPAYRLTPPGTAGYTCRTEVRTDPEAARKLLAEAGFPDGKGFPRLQILFNTAETHKAIAEAVQQMWKNHLNIDLEIVNQEWKVYINSVSTLNYDIARYGWIGDYIDPNTFLDMFMTDSGNNKTGWSNKEYDRLINEAARTPGKAERLELFQKAESILLGEIPIIPIYHYTLPYFLQTNVKNWDPTMIAYHPWKHVYLETTE